MTKVPASDGGRRRMRATAASDEPRANLVGSQPMEVLAIVGARSGSKGLPGKNVRLLAGRPLLTHVIGAARAARRVTRVILSTDSAAYAAIGRAAGAETPFLRPAELAQDTSLVFEYVEHAVRWLDEHEQFRPDAVVCLMPTTPLIDPADLDRAIDLLASDPAADSVITMCSAKEHPRKAVRLADDGEHVVSYMSGSPLDVAPSNRQGHAPAFCRQGLPIVTRVPSLHRLHSMTGEQVRFVEVPTTTAYDIDDEVDFQFVDFLLRSRGGF